MLDNVGTVVIYNSKTGVVVGTATSIAESSGQATRRRAIEIFPIVFLQSAA